MAYNSAQDWPVNPYDLFTKWFTDAQKKEPIDPNAMCLATVAKNGMPSNRMVLMKDYSEKGFVFYTNSHGRKGTELSETGVAALCFHWKSLGKQVRAIGSVEMVSITESDTYFATRPRTSQIGAWASAQSRPLDHRTTFEDRITFFEQKFQGLDTIPRPPHWNGYRLPPQELEFWMNEDNRLHRRCLYTPHSNGTWHKEMLYP